MRATCSVGRWWSATSTRSAPRPWWRRRCRPDWRPRTGAMAASRGAIWWRPAVAHCRAGADRRLAHDAGDRDGHGRPRPQSRRARPLPAERLSAAGARGGGARSGQASADARPGADPARHRRRRRRRALHGRAGPQHRRRHPGDGRLPRRRGPGGGSRQRGRAAQLRLSRPHHPCAAQAEWRPDAAGRVRRACQAPRGAGGQARQRRRSSPTHRPCVRPGRTGSSTWETPAGTARRHPPRTCASSTATATW